MQIKAEAFAANLEMGVYSFDSFEDWRHWRSMNPWFSFQSAPREIVDHCLTSGIASTWFGPIPHGKVSCANPNFRESLRGNGFNPRQRAILETLLVLTRGREQDVRIYAAEGITPFARELKARYPKFVGSEYAPSVEEQARIAPVEHQDLAALTYLDESFDICITNEVMEHLPDLDASLSELHRVLRPSGVLISTFPFLHDRPNSITKARMLATGDIEHLMEPEYHGNPVDPKGGSLVFQVPAWDILEKCKACGFIQSRKLLVSSKKAGITARDYPGVFILIARKL
ncbi:MAG: class I SAM-dependent methyltransferase [Roseovarius sp.]|nr:class I SAM-dependent methyltransferase [Roseovarius sp.]